MGEGIRIDTGFEQGGEVSQFYDPMIAKLIVHAETREEAAAHLAEAARSVEVWPVKTNAGFIARCLEHPRFVAGDVDTGFIAAEEEALAGSVQASPLVTATAFATVGLRADDVAFRQRGEPSPWMDGLFAFRLNGPAEARTTLHRDGHAIHARLKGRHGPVPIQHSSFDIDLDGQSFFANGMPEYVHVDHVLQSVARDRTDRVVVFDGGDTFEFTLRKAAGAGGITSDGALRAPMPGKIVATPATPGDIVTKGQPVVVLEAMKMEHALVAPFDGVVGEMGVSVGDQVTDGTVLAVIEAAT